MSEESMDNIEAKNEMIEAYLQTDRYDDPKEQTKYLTDYIEENCGPLAGKNLLDIGCGAGELLFHLKNIEPSMELFGIDYSEDLVEYARKHIPDAAQFEVGEAETFQLDRNFDILTMVGVHTIFDDFRPCFRQMLDHMQDDGHAIIFGKFNPYDVDMIMRYRNNYFEDRDWQSGHTIYSIKTVSSWLDENNLQYEFIPWTIPIDLEPRDNPTRSWTMKTEDGERLVVNGIGLILRFHLLHLQRKG